MNLQPNTITTYIVVDGSTEKHYIPADCGFTRGMAWETVERRSVDSSHTAQAISVLKKYGYQPTTYQVSFNIYQALMDDSIYNAISEYESLIGKAVHFVYSNRDFGEMVITDGSVALTIDGMNGVRAIQISYNMRESIVVTATPVANVRTM